jgi:hypothetical protein
MILSGLFELLIITRKMIDEFKEKKILNGVFRDENLKFNEN